jgi:hypothetical protein
LIQCPIGIAEDIPVQIRNSFIPADFVVHEMDVCQETPHILRRPFLSTAEATIDVTAGIIRLNISGKGETFTLKPKGVEQCNQLRVLAGAKKNAKSSKKKLDSANYSTSNFLWCIKNATLTVPKSPVVLAN